MPLNTEVERWSTHLHLHGGRYAPPFLAGDGPAVMKDSLCMARALLAPAMATI